MAVSSHMLAMPGVGHACRAVDTACP